MQVFTIGTVLRIFQYASPKGCYHHPRVIDPGLEEIEVIVAGRGDFLVDGGFVEAVPGSMLWYTAGEVVEVTSHVREPYNTIVFVFESSRNGRPSAPMLSHWRDPLACASFCTEMLQAFQNEDRSTLLAELSYSRLAWESRQGLRREPEGDDPVIARMNAYIEAHYLEPTLQVKDIAAAAGISASHLHLLLRKQGRESPLQAVLTHRLARARLLLRSTDLPIKRIALESGFTEVNHFCRSFRKVHTQSPGNYRRGGDSVG